MGCLGYGDATYLNTPSAGLLTHVSITVKTSGVSFKAQYTNSYPMVGGTCGKQNTCSTHSVIEKIRSSMIEKIVVLVPMYTLYFPL